MFEDQKSGETHSLPLGDHLNYLGNTSDPKPVGVSPKIPN